MNSKTKMLGLAIPVWAVIGGILAAGSLAIAVQPVSDEKIHIQDTTGKIQTNVPVAASRAFSPLAVQWNANTEAAADSAGGGTLGSTIQTTQKLVVNSALDVSSAQVTKLFLTNNSEDKQIFLIKAGAPANVMIDFNTPASPDTSFNAVTVQGVTGHNEWLATLPGSGTNSGNAQVNMEISTTDAGFYPIVVELERVG